MSIEAPLVARALADEIAVPHGLGNWLKDREKALRRAASSLDKVARRMPLLPETERVAAEVRRTLEDREHGALPRLLRRPLWQLRTETPSVRAFGRLCRDLVERCDAVLALQEAAASFRSERAAVEAEFGDRMPNLLAGRLREGCVDAAALESCRRASDVLVLGYRLSRIRRELRALATDLPEPLRVGIASTPAGSRFTTAELAVLLTQRLRSRHGSAGSHLAATTLRGLAARQVRGLGAATDWTVPARTHAHALAEHLGRVALEDGGRTLWSGEDADLWTGFVSAAARAAYDPAAETAWAPELPPRGKEDDVLPEGNRYYVVPIGDSVVYVSRDVPAAARVWSAGIGVGKTLAVRAFSDVPNVDPELVRLDLEPLFDGVGKVGPGWYRAKVDARITLVSEWNDGWFGTVAQKGRLQESATPVWEATPPSPGAFRITPRPGRSGAAAVPVGPAHGEAHEWLHHVTVPVRTPFERPPLAWLRTGSAGDDGASAAAERELFLRLGRRGARLALRHLGCGVLATDGRTGDLYSPPFAVRAAGNPPLRAWMGDQPLAFIRCVARLTAQVHAAGYALGSVHTGMFAFSMAPEPCGEFGPRALLCYAPCATPLGRYLTPPRACELMYERLGFRGQLPWLAEGMVALPETDAASLALLALDLLALQPLRAVQSGSWEAFLATLATCDPSVYAVPSLAIWLCEALHEWSLAGVLPLLCSDEPHG